MTIAKEYTEFKNSLRSIYEEREAEIITDWVFEHITGKKRWERRITQINKLDENSIDQLDKYLKELLNHKPVQYVLNEAWFCKRMFYVNEHVLIPRPETEELVEWVVDDFRSLKSEVGGPEFKILDIGTGSGCIAISIKKEIGNINVTAIDLNEDAISVAKKNADLIQAKIDFIRFNFFDESSWHTLGVYNLIVSNPPYIPQKEKELLAKNVTAFEPQIALFVPDNAPCIFYEKIAKFAQSHLADKGKIYVETHEAYCKEVLQIFLKNNFNSAIKKDIYGKERMVKAEIR